MTRREFLGEEKDKGDGRRGRREADDGTGRAEREKEGKHHLMLAEGMRGGGGVGGGDEGMAGSSLLETAHDPAVEGATSLLSSMHLPPGGAMMMGGAAVGDLTAAGAAAVANGAAMAANAFITRQTAAVSRSVGQALIGEAPYMLLYPPFPPHAGLS